MRRVWFFLVIACACVGSASAASGPIILHEPLPYAKGQGSRTDRVVPADDPQALAKAIQTGSGTIAQPKLSQTGDDTPVYHSQSTPRVGIDRRTGADGHLHYKVVFDPSIAPFKREIAYDSVRSDVTLAQSGKGMRLVATYGQARPGHELFWGHIRLQLQKGTRVVLPSVAPTSQILQWQVVPQVALRAWRDDAGNFSVDLDPDAPSQQLEVDLRYLMDAPSEYFAAPLGVQKHKDDPEVIPLPADLQQRAKALWPALSLAQHMERSAALNQLVTWFRSFEPGEPPEKTEDPLADLVLSRKGVCRHRALGLMVMATSLGIPCHYVMNDAHAFIEAWAPLPDGHGAWQRIDLGGGAESLELQAAQDKHLHQPQWRDPFPRPDVYAREIADGNGPGAGSQPWGGAKEVRGGAFAPAAEQGGAPPATAGNSAPVKGNAAQASAAPAPASDAARRQWLRDRAERLTAPVESPTPGDRPPQEGRKATSTALLVSQPMAWIGETLQVSGQVRSGTSQGVAGKPVELWLIDPAHPLKGRLLGVAMTTGNGTYRLDLAIPADTDLQVYDLIARFPGDPHYWGSDSTL